MAGNDRYEGFVPDMLELLSEILRFNYTIRYCTRMYINPYMRFCVLVFCLNQTF
jgi:hypothetical protein